MTIDLTMLAPAAPPRPRRFVVQHEDGRLLALGYAGGRIIPLWLGEADRQKAWTWPSMTAAVMAALDVDQGDLPATGPWRVVEWRP